MDIVGSMMKVLLIIAAILLAPVLIAIVLGVTAFVVKLALAVGVLVLIALGLKKLLEPSTRTYGS